MYRLFSEFIGDFYKLRLQKQFGFGIIRLPKNLKEDYPDERFFTR